jgi:Holliday junction resolvase RusA-like endonuclease
MIDRPFGAPIDIQIDLPVPPSTNRIWQRAKSGKRAVYTSPEYKAWKRAADDLVAAMAQFRGVKPILGAFEATIILSERHTRIDLDNSVKALLDYAVRSNLVVDDAPKFLRRLLVEWGHAPHGCRLILRPREPN